MIELLTNRRRRIGSRLLKLPRGLVDAGDRGTGFWFPVQATVQGNQLDWGAGIYGGGKLKADLRVINGDGAQVDLRINTDGSLSTLLFAENKFGSKIETNVTMKRLARGSRGEEKLGFRERFYKDGFNGSWIGNYDIKGCEATSYREGSRKF